MYAQLGEQIGYEIKQQDVSRPWMIAGTVVVIIGAAGALVVGRADSLSVGRTGPAPCPLGRMRGAADSGRRRRGPSVAAGGPVAGGTGGPPEEVT